MRANLRERHLMRSERALDRQTIHLLGPGPALWAPEDDHGPSGPTASAISAGRPLNGLDLIEGLMHDSRHLLVSVGWLGGLDEMRRISVSGQAVEKLPVRDPRQDRRVRNLVPVQMEDRQHGPVPPGVKELVGVP